MRTDTGSRLMAAEPGEVFRAFTDPELLLRWLPPAGMTGRFERFDARTGYRMVLTYGSAPAGGGKATADADITDVRRVEVTPHRIIEEVDFPSDDPAFAGTMTMTWEIEARSTGTHVSVEATNVPQGITPEEHAEGIASSLANLAALVEE